MSSLKDKKSFKIELAVALIPAGVATGLAEGVIGRIVDIGSDGAPIVDFPKTRQEVVADHATPFGSSPPMRPISRKFQRTARLKDCSQSRCNSGEDAPGAQRNTNGARELPTTAM